jgi:hypothetical protein
MRQFFLLAVGFSATMAIADEAACIQGNCVDGVGTFVYAGDTAGGRYEGHWKNGKRHGKGSFPNCRWQSLPRRVA